MSKLQHRQDLIKAKRMKTEWRYFVMEIASWFPIMFYRNNGKVGRYWINDRITKHIVEFQTYYQESQFNLQTTLNDDKNYMISFSNLLKSVTLPLFQNSIENENSLYADIEFAAKNCYLSSVAIAAENVLYSFQCKNVNNVLNSVFVQQNSINIYQSIGVLNSHNVFYSQHIRNSSDIFFSSELNGCSHCILCIGFSNISYCINNKQYTKEEYENEKLKILGNKGEFEKLYNDVKSNNGGNSELISQFNNYCENVEDAFYSSGVNNGKKIIFVGDSGDCKNCYDVFSAGMNAYDFYAVAGAGYNSSNAYCCAEVTIGCHNVFYSYFLENCSFCLFCSGLIGQSYCILNKQYTKEERYTKVDEIFGQMHEDGTLGDFFPATMNPFYFNDTAAYLIDPTFTKEEVTAAGYLRRDEPIKVDIPEGALVVKTSELDRFEGRKPVIASEAKQSIDNISEIASSPSHNSQAPRNDESNQQRYINPDILKYIIQDEQGNIYRIVKMEYDFLMKHALPLPRKHWLDRMKENFRIH